MIPPIFPSRVTPPPAADLRGMKPSTGPASAVGSEVPKREKAEKPKKTEAKSKAKSKAKASSKKKQTEWSAFLSF